MIRKLTKHSARNERNQSKRRSRGNGLAAIGLFAFGGSSFFLTGAASAATGWQYQQLDTDACYDAATLDTDGNGNANEVWLDQDNDCAWDIRFWNSVGNDSLLESATLDMNEDGHWEVWLADTNGTVGFEAAYVDYNGDGYSDRSYALTQPAIGTGSSGNSTFWPSTGTIGSGTSLIDVYAESARIATDSWMPQPDSDHDQWLDFEDSHPYDPYRH